MRTLVESLKRLYEAEPQKVTKEQLKVRVVNRIITEEEYKYITGEDYVV